MNPVFLTLTFLYYSFTHFLQYTSQSTVLSPSHRWEGKVWSQQTVLTVGRFIRNCVAGPPFTGSFPSGLPLHVQEIITRIVWYNIEFI